jgi:excisionase family DNA binding protein
MKTSESVPMIPGMLLSKDVARELGVSVTSINRAARAGRIPFVMVGRQRRFDPSVIDRIKRFGLPTRHVMEEQARRHSGLRSCAVHLGDDMTCACQPPGR